MTTQANGTGPDLIQVNDLQMHFPVTKGVVFQRQVGAVKAVDGVSFSIKKGETLGLVGESGCGKSTTGRAILQLYRPTAGSVLFQGQDLVKLKGEELRRMREAAGLMRRELAQVLGLEVAVVRLAEAGRLGLVGAAELLGGLLENESRKLAGQCQ